MSNLLSRRKPETLTFASHRILMSGHSMAREFDRGMISKTIPVNVLNLAGILPQAKCVVFHPFDTAFGFESLDLPDALHPQTLLTYGMNGQEIPTDHGAPVHLRVARQLGYKSVKYLARITVTDNLKGYSWYAGI